MCKQVSEGVSKEVSGQTEQTFYEKKPFTVSAVFYDGSGKFISHVFAADAQAARDDVLMKTAGAAVIVSVFNGHLVEADKEVFSLNEPFTQTEAAGCSSELQN